MIHRQQVQAQIQTAAPSPSPASNVPDQRNGAQITASGQAVSRNDVAQQLVLTVWLRNFGETAAVAKISGLLFVDGAVQATNLGVPERIDFPPGYREALRFTFSVRAKDAFDAIWSGTSLVDVSVTASYTGDSTVPSVYRYRGRLDAPAATIITVQSITER